MSTVERVCGRLPSTMLMIFHLRYTRSTSTRLHPFLFRIMMKIVPSCLPLVGQVQLLLLCTSKFTLIQMLGQELPVFCAVNPEMTLTSYICWRIARQTVELSKCRASLLSGWYQIILLGDTRAWTTYLELLDESGMARSQACDLNTITITSPCNVMYLYWWL